MQATILSFGIDMLLVCAWNYYVYNIWHINSFGDITLMLGSTPFPVWNQSWAKRY